MIFNFFASGSEPHISLPAEDVITINGVTISNSVVLGSLMAIILIVAGIWMAKKIKIQPVKGVAQFFEMIVEFLIGMMTDVFGSREKGIKYAPVFGTFFVIIVMNYLAGILPIAGAGIVSNTADGAIPLFRSFTADLNATLGMSLVAVVIVQILSIKESGLSGHLKHYFTDKPFNPIYMFVGILEVFGEFVRVMSLALRLFLNTVVGEILIVVFIWVGKDAAPIVVLPIILFEVLVALIQAYVFTVLAATYLALAIAHHGEHEEDHHDDVVIKKVEKAASPA